MTMFAQIQYKHLRENIAHLLNSGLL